MFGVLKKKFNDFTEKIFGKSKDKLHSKEQDSQDKSSIQESESLQVPSELSQDTEVAQDVEFQGLEKTPEIEPAQSILKPEALPVQDVSSNLGPSILKPEALPEHDVSSNLGPSVLKPEALPEHDVSSNLGPSVLKPEALPGQDSSSNLGQSILKPGALPEQKGFSEEYTQLESKRLDVVKKTTLTKFKSLFTSKIKLSEEDISNFLDDFEIALLEADVSIDSSSAIVSSLKKNLINISFSKNNLLQDIKDQIKIVLEQQLNIDCNINNYFSKEAKPLVILVIGPNGAGKTTTISKLANFYKKQNLSVVLASSDTFRAGSIDQLEAHANKLNLKIVKQKYGSDPAAVAFDAVASAKANKNDVVLIDTAGRQDTNINLMQELAKIKRVVNPHLILYVGESQSGQAIVEQIKKFDLEIGITGVILTKIDTDPKGGVAISILNEIKKPIFYIGTGQEYDDLVAFSPRYIIDRII